MNAPARISGYQNAHQALCDRRLVQSMYSECNVLMERVLLTLHGEAHTCRRAIEWKLFRRDFARYYEREVFPATLKRTLAPYLLADTSTSPNLVSGSTSTSVRILPASIDPRAPTLRPTLWWL